jgi:hypothetical protein
MRALQESQTTGTSPSTAPTEPGWEEVSYA